MSGRCAKPRSVAIVGGGLAGMAAAEAARRQGLEVELFEARARLGGRAGSARDPRSGRWIDGQHIALGCCTELLDFCRRLGIEDCFRRDSQLSFFGPDGRRCDLGAAWWLPAPLHLMPSLLGLTYLSLAERLRTMGLVARLAYGRHDDTESLGAWLSRHGCSAAELRLFWGPILASALGELPDRLALAPAAQVVRETFLGPRGAYQPLVPRMPFAEIYDHRAGTRLAELGVVICRSTRVAQIEGDRQRVSGLLLADGRRVTADAIIVAVPWRRVRRLLSPALQEALPELTAVDRIPAGSITGVHLWFDRPINRLAHAGLPGRVSQWVFQPDAAENYYQVSISASHRLELTRGQLLAEVLRELAAVFPAAGDAQLLHHRIVIDPAAVFVLAPGVERLRPVQRTAIGNFFLAGDWTRTGWPATMEGAIRSGRRAVAAMVE